MVTIAANVAKPAAGGGQILIEVHAAGLNPADSALHLGYFQKMAPLKLPATLGFDLAGVVLETGPGVEGFKAGEKVYGQASILTGASGAFAEYAAARAEQLARLPASLGFTEAAALPLAGVSALQALQEHIKLKAGDRILVHGGGGGIGAIAIQLAKRLGAHVAATSSEVSYVKGLGADEVIEFEKQSFQNLLKDYDAVLDTVGGETYKNSFAVLRKGGVLVSMLEQPNAELSAKFGVTSIAQFTQVNTEKLDRLSRFVADGTIKARVGRIFPLEQAREAFLAREAGKVRGKVVLQVR